MKDTQETVKYSYMWEEGYQLLGKGGIVHFTLCSSLFEFLFFTVGILLLLYFFKKLIKKVYTSSVLGIVVIYCCITKYPKSYRLI